MGRSGRIRRTGVAAAVGFLSIHVASTSSARPAEDTQQEARSGRAAIVAMGDDLDVVAARHDLRVDELVAMFETDPSARLDHTGRIFFVDDFPDRPGHAEHTEHAELTGLRAVPSGFDPDDAFRLHSRPGAKRVIYLDFTGHTIRDSVWNEIGGFVSVRPPYDDGIDGNPGRFSTAERRVVHEVWQRVAEDYAPFDIDVTTEEPPADRITRSGRSDQFYGTRALIAPSRTPAGGFTDPVCSSCAGIAYLGVFDEPVLHAYYQPALVLSDRATGAVELAEVVSHEVGHNLGLSHDGGGGSGEYHAGYEEWGPIMGAPYTALTQWNDGSYRGSTNQQDDVAVIASNGGTRVPDDHGGTVATATVWGDTAVPITGTISTADDVDAFAFTVASTRRVSIRIAPAEVGPNLDVRAVLRRADGTGVVADDGTGLGACTTADLAAGSYVVLVDGTGRGDPFAIQQYGYTDDGSLGRYSVVEEPCAAVPRPADRFVVEDDGFAPVLEGVAIGPDGDVVVADSNRFVVERRSVAGVLEATIGLGELQSPTGVAVTSADDVYVSDRSCSCVVRFAAAGGAPLQFGTEGTGAVSRPTDLALDPRNGDVLVVDQGNERIVRFGSNGVYLAEYATTRLDDPVAVAVDADGDIYVTDVVWSGATASPRLQRFSATGVFEQSIPLGLPGDTATDPSGVAVDTDGTVYVVDADKGEILVIEPGSGTVSGRASRGAPLDWRPDDVTTGADGELWIVGDGGLVERLQTGPYELAPPSVTISEPAAGVIVRTGGVIRLRYACTDEAGGSGIASCRGPVPSGSAIDTTFPGRRTVTVVGVDRDGNTTRATRTVRIVAPNPDGRIRPAGTTAWSGNDVYTFGSQYVVARARPGRTAVCEVSLQNDAIVSDRFAVQMSAGSVPGYTATVRRADGTNVTAAVTGGRYRTPVLAPGATHLLRVRVAIRSSPVPTSSYSAQVVVSSLNSEIGSDAVTCAVFPR